MKKVLVTGGAGYIGSVLVPYLLELGHQVTVLDNLRYGQSSLFGYCYHPNFNFINGDVRNENTVKFALDGVDVVIPLAASVGAATCSADPIYAQQVNVDSIKILASLVNDEQMILYPNTNSGYGIGEQTDFCTEESPLRPISLYGISKVESEKILLSETNAISFRLATVFGPSAKMRIDLLVNNFTYKAVNDGVLVLFEQNFRRNYIHVLDVAKAFVHGINNFDSMKGQVYNMGLSSANLTKRQLAEKIKEYIPNLEIIGANYSQDPDKRDYIVSNERLEATGWAPTQSLDDGIQQLIKMYSMMKSPDGYISTTRHSLTQAI
jgi:nucleoside-diphosphate-sugar epimerase